MSYAEGLQLGQERIQQREMLSEQKRQFDAQLMQKGYNPDGSIIPNSDAEVQNKTNQALVQSLNALQGKLASQDSDKGIIDYAQTGDATYLQNTLNNNPLLKQAWSNHGVQGVANLDFQNDGKLLAQHGLPESAYDTPDKQAVLKKNLYKVYDGKSWRLGELQNVVQTTGLLDRTGQKQGGVVLDNHQQLVSLLQGPKVSPYTAEGHKYEAEIQDAATATGLPPNLIASMMAKESKGNPNAVSNVDGKAYKGLMQVGAEAAADVGMSDISTPGDNIMAGALYMKKMLTKFHGNLDLALAGYNAGPGKVQQYGGVPPFAETQDYVKTIKANYAKGEMYYNADDMTATPDKLLQKRMGQLQEKYAPIAADGTRAVSDYFGVDNPSSVPAGTPNDQEMLNQLDKNKRVGQRADQQINTINDFFKEQNTATGKVKVAGDSAEKRTADEKNLEQAGKLKAQLKDAFGGEDNFFKTDFSKPENFNKAMDYVVQINKLQGTKFDAADKKNITEVRGLIALGDPASTLTNEQTGMFDSAFADVRKSFSDNIGGVEARTAYATFRNITRHALAGSALTEQEIKFNDQALGPDTQKRGPILAQLKVALGQVKTRLDSAGNLGDPVTSRVLLGADQDKLNSIMTGLQQRIDALENPEEAIANLKSGGSTGNTTPRPSLDDILGTK